jgi:hypothetical protein
MPPGYQLARSAFLSLSENRRVELQIMLTAAGFWPAVPNKSFSDRLFFAISGFQVANGFAATGYLTAGEAGRLEETAQPILAKWGLASIRHPVRGHPIWVPLGLGLRSEGTGAGLVFTDAQGRFRLDYGFYAGMQLERAYASWTDWLVSHGDQIVFTRIRSDFFAIAARNGSGPDRYVRFQQDGLGIIGFALSYDGNDWELHGDRLEVLISASLWSAMTPSAPFMPLPEMREMRRPAVSEVPPVAEAKPAPAPEAPTRGVSVQAPPPEPAEASGTGVFVSSQGHIVTTAHLIESCSAIEIVGADGPIRARLIGVDKAADLALLKSDATPVRVAGLRTGVRLGEPVAAFGYAPAGSSTTAGSFAIGNVTALAGPGNDTRTLQVSTPAQKGGSGGPLLDASGNFIGVLRVTGGNVQANVNVAIRSSVILTLLEGNGVDFESGNEAELMAPADLAEHARELSVSVRCG